MSPPLRLRRVGENGVLLETPDNSSALRVAHRLRTQLDHVLEDVVPGHRSVLVTWVPAAGDLARALLEEATRSGADTAPPLCSETVELGVRYEGPDLPAVAAFAGLTAVEVVRRHSSATYRVAFIGFAPGFAYLVGGDPALELPRREEPRLQVPQGSVGLAGPYTAVYPGASPGGWQIIGRTAEPLFSLERTSPARLLPGMSVRFRPQR